MPPFRQLILIATMISVSLAYAQSEVAEHTIGVRAAALTIQQIIAVPPLPSLDADSKWHITVQGAYVTGTMERMYASPGFSQGFSGKPTGQALGLGYTSSSRGKFSSFALAVLAKIKADVGSSGEGSVVSFHWKVKDSDITSGVVGYGGNYVLLGSVKSRAALGVFGGGYYFGNKTRYTFSFEDTNVSTLVHADPITSDSANYGPMAGVQIKLRSGPLSITPYTYKYWDLTNHCLDYTYDGRPFKCIAKMDNTFWATGIMAGVYGLRLGLMLTLDSRIDSSDTKLKVWQLGYTFDF